MADAAENLSPEQTERLIHFQELTGIDDLNRCRQTLERHNWDMEVAVQNTISEQEGSPSVFNQPPPPEPRTPQMDLQPNDQRIFTVQARQPQGLFQWSYFIITFPFRFVYTTLLDVIRFAFQIIRPDPRRTTAEYPPVPQWSLHRAPTLSNIQLTGQNDVTDPAGDVERFIINYNEKYGVTHPVFYQGSYSQALNDAKRELRFLLVYLHGLDHQDTETFCRSTLGDQQVINFINVSMLFWACDTNSPEGYRVSQALRENTYPFLALVVLRENRMTVVARVEGPIEGGDLIQRLETVMSDNESSIVAARADREERSFNQSLRQQQDEAYQQSLMADQEKERKKREEREKEEQEQERLRKAKEDHSKMLEEREQRKDQLRCDIPEEPPTDSPDGIHVVLKLPDGTRIGRRFLKSQSLKYLYYFTFCHEKCPDDFHIVTNFPRKTLPCEPTDDNPEPITFEEARLGKNELLFVQDNEA